MTQDDVDALLARPYGIHEPSGDPGMLMLDAGGTARCGRCDFDGVPTLRGGSPLLECPRCQTAPLARDFEREGRAACETMPNPVVTEPYSPRRIMRGASGAAWLKGTRHAKVPGRNEPCYCGSGAKYKKCHGR